MPLHSPVLSDLMPGHQIREDDSMTDPQNSQIIIGVDTHKLTHVAVAIDSHGKRLSEKHVSANTQGYGGMVSFFRDSQSFWH